MIVVVNLLKSVFYYLFISMLTIELVFLIISVIGYYQSLTDNFRKINNLTIDEQVEITNDFANLITSELQNVKSDLLIIAKHIYPLYISFNNSSEKKYLKFNLNSPLHKNLLSFNPFLTFNDSELYENFNIYSKKWQNYSKEDENFSNNDYKIVDKFLNDNDFNKIFIYSSDNLIMNDNMFPYMKVYVNYLIPVLKTIMVRNAIYDKGNPIYSKFHIILNNKYLLEYPPNLIKKSKAKSNLIYFNESIPNCNTGDSYTICVTPMNTLNNEKAKNLQESNVVFDDIKFNSNGEFVSRGCIKINFYDIPNSFVCIEFGLSSLLNKINGNYLDTQKFNKNKFVSFFIFSKNKESNNLDLYFSSRYNINNITDKLKVSKQIDLKIGLYESYNLTKDNQFDLPYITENSNEYDKFYKNITEKYFQNQEKYDSSNKFYQDVINMFYKRPNNEYRRDITQLFITPIYLKSLKYDEKNFIFINQNSSFIPDDNSIICHVMVSTMFGVI